VPHDALQRYRLRHMMRYGPETQKQSTWTNAPLVQVPRGGREAARRPPSENSGALGQDIEPSESNAADMGVM
jgi:hypothetical protein